MPRERLLRWIRVGRVAAVALPVLFFFDSRPGSGAPSTRESNTKQECAICHVTWIDPRQSDSQLRQADGWEPVPIQETIDTVSQEKMCYSCHDGFVRDSRHRVWEGKGHSVGKVPSEDVQLPVTFPLDTKGRVYCGTCHFPHGVSEQTAEVTGSVFLRVENLDSQLCKTCHIRKMKSPRHVNHPLDVPGKNAVPREIFSLGGRLASDPKKVICQSCHTPHGKGTLVAPVRNSKLCFFCHDDKRSAGGQPGRSGPPHPVHVKPSNEMADDVKQSIFERPGSLLGKQGEVECMSCHSMHRGGRRYMLAWTGKEDFCTGCHRGRLEKMTMTKHDLLRTAPQSKNRHGLSPEHSGLCGTCHLAHGWAPKGTKAKSDVSDVCVSCHNRNGLAKKETIGEYTHPIGRPTEHMKNDSPLKLISSGGKATVACSSCHDPHNYDPNLDRTVPSLEQDGDSTNSFLRLPGQELCGQCHVEHYWVDGTKHDLREPKIRCTEQERLAVQQGGVCMGCHRVHNAKSYYLWAMAPYPSADLGGQLCGGCHSEGKSGQEKRVFEFNHPVGVPLSEEREIDLPMYNKECTGQGTLLACFSCHDAHRWAPIGEDDPAEERFTEGSALNSFLRRAHDADASLCLSCHPDKALVTRTDHDMRFSEPASEQYSTLSMESSVCSGCHLAHSNDPDRKLWVEGLFGEGNEAKRACFACHNPEGRAGGKILKTVHPLSRSDNSEDQLNLSLIIRDEIVQVPVAMTCRSCHNPHRWSPEESQDASTHGKEGDGLNSFLMMPTLPDGDLCLNCHRDKTSLLNTKHDLRLLLKQEGKVTEEIGNRISHGGPCFACHMVHNSKKERFLWAYELQTGQSLAEKMCFSCHSKGNTAKGKIPHRYTHPQVMLEPSIQQAKISSELTEFLKKCIVYDEKGTIVCFTCHNPHRWEAGVETPWKKKSFKESAKTRFLRAKNDEHVCKICHGMEGLYRYLYFHQWDKISSEE